MRILVCGGRDYADQELAHAILDMLKAKWGDITIIHGGARGADEIAGLWAMKREVPQVIYRADWAKHGKAAGPLRNQFMLDDGKPDLFIAFPGGKGTEDMVNRLRKAGISGTILKKSP